VNVVVVLAMSWFATGLMRSTAASYLDPVTAARPSALTLNAGWLAVLLTVEIIVLG
jgi:hypothetical protein